LLRKIVLFTSALFFVFEAVPAQKFDLTVDNIMRGPGLVGYEPSEIRWSGDSERIYFQWKQASDPIPKESDTYVANRDGTGLRKLSEEEAKSAPPFGGDTTKDKRLTVFAHDGDIFVYDRTSGQRRRITNTVEAESNPHFLRDGKRVYFTRGENLFVMSLDGGSLVQLTDIRTKEEMDDQPGRRSPAEERRRKPRPPDLERKKGTESQEYLRTEERELLEAVRERAATREDLEAKRRRENPRKHFTLEDRQFVTTLQLSPDEKYVTAIISQENATTKSAVVPSFVNEAGYTEDIRSRTKVGDVQPKTRLAVIEAQTGEAKWIEGEAGRQAQLFQPVWSEDGTKAALMARSFDNKDRWILALDAGAGKTRKIVALHDDAWVDGPGFNLLGWMKGDRELYFESERSGFAQLYAIAWDGGEPRALTSGNWEVNGVDLSPDKSMFYLTTSEAGSGERQLYEMPAEGGARTRITTLAGNHAAVVAPNQRWIADLYSYTNKPPEIYVQELRPGAQARKITSSPAPEFFTYPWLDAPVVTFAARDGAMLHARLYKPANFKSGGPAVVFVHGAGYLQNVHHWWSSYYHEYLFHHVLMERGFVVIDVDYRGSAGYGRDWRTGIYRHMGGKDLDDNVDAARWLAAHHGVNPKRIGLYGGSYGGFITLMAMFTQPDVFAAGAALRPVTDWAHYNHPYTANILNLPQQDAEAYKQSSPIYFAKGLKGALLICHGMADTNVHFQDTVRLVQKLIELRKENWDLAVYPVEDHAFREPSSWADEYKRILKLFETNLNAAR
jgi:dipeptidyl aminopeptidase/acylaminoacyl peptidase